MNCKICNSDNLSKRYVGPIRSGGVGSDFINGYSIYECNQCGFAFLDPTPESLDKFYETHEYREKFDYQFSPADIHRKYDHEQNDRIQRIGIQNIRGKVVLDLGASAGVFLDSINGVANRTIAVEPGGMFKDYLISQNHTYYPYPEDAINAGEVTDVVTSFDVIEHVIDPKKFVVNANKLLKSGGTFYLSMPNYDDLLLSANKEKFEPFFFQVAHINYFGKKVIPELFRNSGFTNIEIGYIHKYGIENLIQWSKNGKPGTFEDVINLFDEYFNRIFKVELERLCIASHLFIKASKV